MVKRGCEFFPSFDPIFWGIDYAHSVGNYVRNKARTVTGEIIAKDADQAWIRTGSHHVTVNLSDLEPAPKPLKVGDTVKDPDGFVRPGVIVALRAETKEACVDYGSNVGLVVEDLSRLEHT